MRKPLRGAGFGARVGVISALSALCISPALSAAGLSWQLSPGPGLAAPAVAPTVSRLQLKTAASLQRSELAQSYVPQDGVATYSALRGLSLSAAVSLEQQYIEDASAGLASRTYRIDEPQLALAMRYDSAPLQIDLGGSVSWRSGPDDVVESEAVERLSARLAGRLLTPTLNWFAQRDSREVARDPLASDLPSNRRQSISHSGGIEYRSQLARGTHLRGRLWAGSLRLDDEQREDTLSGIRLGLRRHIGPRLYHQVSIERLRIEPQRGAAARRFNSLSWALEHPRGTRTSQLQIGYQDLSYARQAAHRKATWSGVLALPAWQGWQAELRAGERGFDVTQLYGASGDDVVVQGLSGLTGTDAGLIEAEYAMLRVDREWGRWQNQLAAARFRAHDLAEQASEIERNRYDISLRFALRPDQLLGVRWSLTQDERLGSGGQNLVDTTDVALRWSRELARQGRIGVDFQRSRRALNAGDETDQQVTVFLRWGSAQALPYFQ